MPLRRLVVARSGAALLMRHAAAVCSRRGAELTAAVRRRPMPSLMMQQQQQLQQPQRGYHASALRAQAVKLKWRVLGEEIEVVAEEGKTLLEVAHDNDIELEGACGGELACSTCHVVFEPALFEKLPPKQEEEEDMLDLAWGLTDTSRLGCQIKVTPLLEGATITVPEETNDMLGGAPPGSPSK